VIYSIFLLANPDGQIFVLTTNHIDKLDPALLRSGRVDLKIEFPLAAAKQMKAMFRSFYPTLEPFGGCKIFDQTDEESSKESEDSQKVSVYAKV